MKQNTIASQIGSLIQENGHQNTPIPGVVLFRSDKPSPRTSFTYKPAIIIIAQGQKVLYLAGEEIPYNANNYLIMSMPLPLDCQTFASPEEPLLGVLIRIDLPILQSVISQIKNADTQIPMGLNASKCGCAAQTSPLEADMSDSVLRLLEALSSPTDASVLGEGLIREVYYRALQGNQSEGLYHLAQYNSHSSRISEILNYIHAHLADALSVDDLAEKANMSVSTFHRTFKDVAGQSPLQYIKRTRLNNAKNLLEQGTLRINEVAREIGYESVSQFSREFKRLFGVSPKDFSSI